MRQQSEKEDPASGTAAPEPVGLRIALCIAVGFMAVVAIATWAKWRRNRTPRGPAAAVVILSDPPGARAHLDGQYVGLTPVTCRQVPFGEHLLLLEKPAYKPRRIRILVAKPESAFSATLEDEPTAGLRLSSSPPGADVYVDASYRGKTPLLADKLCPGSRQVRLDLPGYETWRQTVVLSSHETSCLHAALRSTIVDRCESRLQANPTDLNTHVELAHHWLVQGDLEKAGDVLGRAWRVAQQRSWHDAEYQRLRREVDSAYIGETSIPGANALALVRAMLARLLYDALVSRPSDSNLLSYAGRLFACDKADQAGVDVLEAVTKRYPENTNAAIVLSRLYVARNSPEKAIAVLGRVTRRQRQNWRAMRLLAEAHTQAGDFSQAKTMLKQCLLYCDDAGARAEVRRTLSGLAK